MVELCTCRELLESRRLLEKSGFALPPSLPARGVRPPPASNMGLRWPSESALKVESYRFEANAGLVEVMVLPLIKGERGAGDCERPPAGERLRQNRKHRIKPAHQT